MTFKISLSYLCHILLYPLVKFGFRILLYLYLFTCMCVRACMRACMRACVHACVRACVRARACTHTRINLSAQAIECIKCFIGNVITLSRWLYARLHCRKIGVRKWRMMGVIILAKESIIFAAAYYILARFYS